jgi:hypothetical protein
MRYLALILFALAGCTALDKDDGSPDPPSDVWPWVCPDGTPVPDSGTCLDAATGAQSD